MNNLTTKAWLLTPENTITKIDYNPYQMFAYNGEIFFSEEEAKEALAKKRYPIIKACISEKVEAFEEGKYETKEAFVSDLFALFEQGANFAVRRWRKKNERKRI